jgi:hypothetical protein
MKLSNETLAILKNFATINQGLYFTEGNELSTKSLQGNILAVAKIEESIPVNFGIYDLNNLLSVISLYKTGAELEFDSKHILIKGLGGRSTIKYRMTDPSMLVIPGDKRPKLPSVDVELNLTIDDLNWIMRSANVLNSTHISVESDGENVVMNTFDAKNDSAHTNSVKMNVVSDKKFKLVFKTENLKMIPSDYNVQICAKGIAKFENTNLTYWISLETNSTYE